MATSSSPVLGRRGIRSVKEHMFQLHNYKRPTFCSHCGNLLVGVVKQGLRCKRCDVDVHEKCQEDLQKPCVEVIVGHHHFREKSYKQLTYCDYCGKLLVGVVNQGLRCTECKANVHEKCQEKIEVGCEAVKSRLRATKAGAPGSLIHKKSRGTWGSGKKSQKFNEKTPLSTMSIKVEGEDTSGGIVNRDYSSLFDRMPEKDEINVSSLPGSPTRFIKREQRSHSLTSPELSKGATRTIKKQVNEVTAIMSDNYSKALRRGDDLKRLQASSDELAERSKIFQENTKELKRHFWWKNKKLWFGVAAAILLLVIVVAVIIVIKTQQSSPHTPAANVQSNTNNNPPTNS